jgi:acetylornithine deacetylase/succinyl-diaminopimelate desuccinylase-like protein
MNRTLVGVIAFALALFIVITLGSPARGQQTSSASGAITDASRAETVRFLTDLVKIDTSNPPGNEVKAANYIKAVLEKEGIASEIFESAPARGNIVARLKGNGSKRPLMLMGHLDVVGVERDKWTVDPFTAVMKDGYLYGRGSRDDKAMDAANLEVFLELHRRKIPLDRDVILLAEAGEEGTTQYGIDFMVAQHWDKIDCEYVLNEGGALHENNGKVDYAGVGTTEKAPRAMTLIARGSSGHASMPRLDNPIEHLGAAVGKLLAWQPPMRLNETTREYFSRLAKISSPEDAYLYTHLEDSGVQQKLAANHISQNSMLRTSIVPTIIKGGFRVNVIPAEAEATLDVRALPDENVDEVMATLKKVINDPEIEIVRSDKTNDRPAGAPSSIHNDMFQALERAQAKLFPGAVTLPMMVTGATDSAQLRAKGVQAYGIGAPTSDDDALRVHGNDERIRAEGEGKFLEYLYTAVVDVAASKK